MKRKYIKPTTEVFASIEEPMMAGSGVDNSGQSDAGGVGAKGTYFMEDESEDNAMGCRYNLWEE
jgi:hypothetical protein